MADGTTRQILERHREALRAKVRAVLPDVLLELDEVELALASIADSSFSSEYAKYHLAVEAVVAYLTKTGRTATGEAIATAVVAGGWLKGHWRAKANVLQSITINALKFPKKNKLVRRFGGGQTAATAEIGLYEWDDSYREAVRSAQSAPREAHRIRR